MCELRLHLIAYGKRLATSRESFKGLAIAIISIEIEEMIPNDKFDSSFA